MKAFKDFERNYSYEYLAQPDGGDKSVVFKFYPKNQYRRLPKEKWVEPIVFEAESLHDAFQVAFSITIHGYSLDEAMSIIDGVKPFDHDAWYKQFYPETFYSVGDKCWKNLAEVLAKEENEKISFTLKKKYEKAN